MPVDLLRLAPNLREKPDGVFEASSEQPVCFGPDAHEGCFELEENSFWFAHRNAVLLDALDAWPPPGFMLDVGGGNGFVTKALEDAGFAAALLEPGPDGVRHARARGVGSVIHATWEGAAFLPESLGAVGLFDVLEHIADDGAFLRSLRASLVSGGRLYLTVPAHPWLWSREDAHAGHFRRYTRRGLVERVTRAGFTPERVTHFFGFLTVPVLLGRTIRSRLLPGPDIQAQARVEHQPPGKLVKNLVDELCARERAWLGCGRPLKVGTSLLLVGRKG